MKKIALVLMFIAVFSFVAFAQTIETSGSFKNGSVRRGSIARGFIVLQIPPELHVNSRKPSDDFLIPTEIKLSSPSIRGFQIFYPKGKDRKFDFSERKLNVYEGKTIIGFSFRIPKSFRARFLRVKAEISYQACSNEVCYPPQTKTIYLQARVL